MSEPLISAQELAQLLGVKLSTIYDWVHTRKISFYKVGRLVKFKRSEIDRWLESQKVMHR